VRKIITVIFWSVATGAFAQIGGTHAFDFLRIPTHARVAALGGVNVSLADKDINFFHNNPSLAGDTLNGFASAGYQFYAGDVGQALFSYAHDFKKLGQFIFGIQHISYGTLQGFDASGMETMEFNSGETAVMIGKTHQITNMRFGATVKAVFSNIAGYRANAMMMDAGGIFQHPEHGFTIGLTIKNLGIVLSEYSRSSSSHLPFDVQAGVTLKPEYMPVRFSITAYHLVNSDLLYYNADMNEAKPSTLKKVISHVNMAAEILFHRNFNVMAGYNYLAHQALKYETGGSGAGVSFGFSVLVKPVEFVFSRSGYAAGNAGYSFTLSTNISNFSRRE
jgi:hypothetical protein